MSYHITETCNGCGACVKLCPVGAIRGERKALHVIDPVLCIACGACGRICPQQALRDPFDIPCERIVKLALWPKPVIDGKRCASCRICIENCPVHCLGPAAKQPDKHERSALIDAKACISCGFCAADCPVEAIVLRTPEQKPAADAS